MPIRATCRSCGKNYTVKEELAGKKIKCRECGEPIRIGNGGTAPQRQREPEESLPPTRRQSGQSGRKGGSRKAAKKSSGNPLLLYGSIGGGVVVVAIACFFLFSGGGNEEANPVSANGGPDTNSANSTPEVAQQSPNETASSNATSAASGTDTANTGASTATTDPPPMTSGDATITSTGTPGVIPNPPPSSDSTPGLPEEQGSGFPLSPDPGEFDYADLNTKAMPFPSGFQIVYSPGGGPIVAVGPVSKVQGMQLWNICSMKQLGEIKSGDGTFSEWSLHAGSRVIATLEGTKRGQVELWSFESGQHLGTVNVETDGSLVSKIVLLSPTRLLTQTSRSKQTQKPVVKLFDISSGTVLKEFPPPPGWTMDFVISPGSNYAASVTKERGLTIMETGSFDLLTKADISHPGFGSPDPKGLAFNHAGDKIASVWMSKTTTELAVTSLSDGKTEMISFGGQLQDTTFGDTTNRGPAIEWLPDDSGWVVFGGTVVDAETKRIVWKVDCEEHWGAEQRMPLAGGFRVITGGLSLQTGQMSERKIDFVKWPLSEVTSLLAGLETNTSAPVRPGLNVTLEVNVANVRFGSPDDAKLKLTEWFTARLEADDFTVASDGPTFRVTYAEQAGQEYHERKSGRPGASATPPAGQAASVESTVGIIDCAWVVEGQPKPVWQSQYAVAPTFVIALQQITPQVARDEMFKQIGDRLAAMPIAWFVSETGTALPGTSVYK